MENNKSSCAGFWRRLGAFVIDMIILGIVGQIIGWTLKDFFFQIGPYGRIIGWIIILLYFGMLNSTIGKGKTIGKRIVKIFVRDQNGNLISFPHSILRTFVFSLPIFLNHLTIPIFISNPILVTIQTVIIFGVGGAIIYTLIFNRKTHQLLHDLICKTYVAKISEPPINELPKTSNRHKVISVTIILLAIILPFVLHHNQPKTIFGINLQNIQTLHKMLSTDTRFFNISIYDKKILLGKGGTNRVLVIQGWYKGMPSKEEREAIIQGFARKALNNYRSISEIDTLAVTITARYDFIFATGCFNYNNTKLIIDWRNDILK